MLKYKSFVGRQGVSKLFDGYFLMFTSSFRIRYYFFALLPEVLLQSLLHLSGVGEFEDGQKTRLYR